MRGRFIFLGTGASLGVPVIGCKCSVCSSDHPHNRRLRPSALIEMGSQTFLIDAGPDFRQQALIHKIEHLDGILFTHAHYDHTAGIDDLRPIYFPRKDPLPVLLSKETENELLLRFRYIFMSQKGNKETFVERIKLQTLQNLDGEEFFEGIRIQYITFFQGSMQVNGYRIGNFAYISDIRNYEEKIFDHLQGVTHLVVSALRFTPTPLHFSIDEAIAFAKRVGAQHVWLTHLSHDLDYEKTNAYLPEFVRLGYDGLTFDFSI